MNIQMPAGGIRELERRMQISELVLRYLSVKAQD